MVTRHTSFPPDEVFICQLARLGDLAQTLPLIRALNRIRTLELLCDTAAAPWGELLPGIARVRTLDSRAWRRRSAGDLAGFPSLLATLDRDPAAARCRGRFLALNDHPVADAVAAVACREDAGSWMTGRLVLIRSYVRLVARDRRLNRLHLADLWASLAGAPRLCPLEPVPAPPSGTQFAKTVLERLSSGKSGGIWTFILGSGANCRRLDPEIFAGWWREIPPEVRPAAVLAGGRGEEELAARFRRAAGSSAGLLDLTGRCSPAELLGIFAASRRVIGVDTGPLHWAAAVGTKVVGMYFAEAGLHDTGPYGEGHWALAPDCPEYPCAPARATACGRRCREAFADPRKMARLLANLEADTPAAAPGLVLHRSRWTPAGNGWEKVTDGMEDPAAAAFARLARRVLGLDSSPALPQEPETARAADRWRAAWSDLAGRFPRPAAVPEKVMEQARRDAVQRLQAVAPAPAC
ncbi:MAG: hypothetical protein C4524_05675 [Candidatus Zixiibacteriota bacterium]|nr:MAG: hypothetical protein C4524_05675 [candidate division Zixibacteria bacterium]